MKLILTQEVTGLGSAGDVVEVKDGYGRNYLIPRGFGIRWTRGGEKTIESITKSRDERTEAAPKTMKSRREIPLLPNVVEVLRAVEHPSDADADTYFFRNPEGGPVTTSWWPKKS